MADTRRYCSRYLIIFIALLCCVAFNVMLQKSSKVVFNQLSGNLGPPALYERDIGHNVIFKLGIKCKITLAKNGFHKTQFSISKWSKHGQTSLLIRGHDPPVDITIHMDISQNPGPNSLATSSSSSSLNLNASDWNLHTPSTIITFTRGELFKLRRASNIALPGPVLAGLKDAGVLHYPGKRAGRRRIGIVISNRARVEPMFSSSLHSSSINANNSVVVPRQPLLTCLTSAVCTKDQLKLCCLNAQSLRNKTADFMCYVYTTEAAMVAVTETWFTQRDIAHRTEATPPGFKVSHRPQRWRNCFNS